MNVRQIEEFELLVSYYQVAVFDSNLDVCFNDWRQAHVEQGFSWRPRSVSFATLDITPMLIKAVLADELQLKGHTIRAIRVPFSVKCDAVIVVATTGFERPVAIPPGEYALTFEHGLQKHGDSMWCVFTFVPDHNAQPAILVADSELSPPSPLLMEADPV